MVSVGTPIRNINLLPGCVVRTHYGTGGLATDIEKLSNEDKQARAEWFRCMGLPERKADYLVTYKDPRDGQPRWLYVWLAEDGTVMCEDRPLVVVRREKQTQLTLFEEAV